MSYTEERNWLITYDITDSRRLVRVHRYLKRHAIPVQYSAFVFHGSQLTFERVLSGIADRIAPDTDDVRGYHLPYRCDEEGIKTKFTGRYLPFSSFERDLMKKGLRRVGSSVASVALRESILPVRELTLSSISLVREWISPARALISLVPENAATVRNHS